MSSRSRLLGQEPEERIGGAVPCEANGMRTGRVTKYKHRFCNTEFGSLKFSKQELGILCVLLLRGPQTPGELRSRTNRLCDRGRGSTSGAIYIYRFVREGSGWRFINRSPYIYYDPPVFFPGAAPIGCAHLFEM